MGRIRVLSDGLINRIAAGEVVERPASVLKELVENALDAGAKSLKVELGAGGKRLIEVVDDGAGMDRDDAVLALERHATSKLGDAADLDRIRTLGFRGEALASIAAVSRLILATAPEDGAGTEVEVRAGRIAAVREVALPRGTRVRVERLFLNVPARRKFLRADATELSHCLRVLGRYALARPDLRIAVVQDGRTLLRGDPTADPLERIAQIDGRDRASRLVRFEAGGAHLRVEGYAGRPVDAAARRDVQYLFVNGRVVQDRLLSHAVNEAYGNTVPRARYAAVYLFLDLDPALVDVNVHPQKLEVRFRDPRLVHDAVRDAVAASLSQEGVVPRLDELRAAGRETLPGAPAPAAVDGVARAAADYLERERGAQATGAVADGRGWSGGSTRPAAGTVSDGGTPRSSGPAPRPLVDAMEGPGEHRAARPLAQYRDSYIVAQDADGILLVDQHAAHERVIFERYLADAERNEVERQRLLFPVTVELRPHEFALVEAELEEFARLGFDLAPFGGTTIRIDSVPAVTADLEPATVLRDLLGEAAAVRSAAAGVEGLRRKLVTSAACQAAIKVNYPLSAGTMQALLDDLFATNNPSTCPHGRPATFRLTLEEIERAFRRR